MSPIKTAARFKTRFGAAGYALITTTLLLFAQRSAQAQDSTAATAKEGGFCWRGRPAPRCSVILLTEFGVYRDLVTPSATVQSFYSGGTPYKEYDRRWDLQAELGLLQNVTEKYAIGGSLFVRRSTELDTEVGAKVRYRRWLNPEGLSVDVGAGIRSVHDRYSRPPSDGMPVTYYYPTKTKVGLTSDVALNVMDYASFVARAEVVPMGDRYQPKLSVGVRGGSRVGTFGLAGFGTAIAILVAVALASYE
ncbi:MAG: hypothetical protein ACO1Q7_05460 [Gemmatimonas sp.]